MTNNRMKLSMKLLIETRLSVKIFSYLLVYNRMILTLKAFTKKTLNADNFQNDI